MLRPTMNRFPPDEANHPSAALPFGALVSPLAPTPPPPSTPTPSPTKTSTTDRKENTFISATDASQLPRCYQCAAYISCRAPINARTWVCPLCNYQNSCPMEYARIIVEGNESKDRVPELSRPLYDIPVTDGQSTQSPPVAYVFILDTAGDMTYLDAARVAIRNALAAVDGQTLVGLVLYDHTNRISYLDTRGTPVLQSIALDSDTFSVAEIFPPDQWLQPSGPALTNSILNVLANLTPSSGMASSQPDVMASTNRPFGPAIRSVIDMLEVTGLLASRVVAIAAGEPNFGIGALSSKGHGTNNEGEQNGNQMRKSDLEKNILPSPSISFYAEQGIRASQLGIMFDLYFVTRMPIDVATLAPLAQISGGRLTLYEAGDDSLSQDVWQHLNDPAVVRGLLRIRTSSEFTVTDVYGCGVYRDHEVPDVYRLGCHGYSSTLAADFAYTNITTRSIFRSQPVRPMCIQVAFRGLFIEPGSLPQWVLRVETQTYGTSASPNTLRREVDANAMTTLVFHRALSAADEQSITAARMLLFDWLCNLLATTATLAPDDDEQIVIDASLSKHQSIQRIPRLIFGLIRSTLFRQEAVAPDARAILRCLWEDLSPELLAAAAYPMLTSYSDFRSEGESNLALTTQSIKQCGDPIYMLDAFSDVIIYYAAPSSSRKELPFPPPESSAIMKARAARIRDRPVTPKLVVCREGTTKDRWFKGFLIEDAIPGAEAQSFSAFMEGATDAAHSLLRDVNNA